MRILVFVSLILASTLFSPMAAAQKLPWQTLSLPPPMPTPITSGTASVNGIRMYFAVFGHGSPILLIHNGLGSSDDWAGVVPELTRHYEVLVADSRGFGRSTRNETPYSYELMASDYVALLQFLKIKKVLLVGTSDGGIIGLDMAIHSRGVLAGLFIQGANSSNDGIQNPPLDFGAIRAALIRARSEYARLSPTPDEYATFRKALELMDQSEPSYTSQQLSTITVPTMIAFSDHEESIKKSHTEYLLRTIPGAHSIVLTGVSHFAPLQDSVQYARAVETFAALLHPW